MSEPDKKPLPVKSVAAGIAIGVAIAVGTQNYLLGISFAILIAAAGAVKSQM